MAALCWCAAAAGQTPPRANVALRYEPWPGCPDATFFVREVNARTKNVAFRADYRDGDHRFHVRLRAAPDGYSGVLFMVDASGAASTRGFQSEHCQEVVVALALVAALALDPNASTAPGALSLQSSAAPAVEQPRADPGWRWATGLSGDGSSGITPVWLIAFGAFLDLERAAPALPSFRLNPYFARTAATGPSVDEAGFYLAAARFEGCTPAPIATGPLELRPCLGLDLGLIHSHGRRVRTVNEQNRLWSSLLVDVRLAAALDERLFLEASGGPVFPLTRHRFVLRNPDGVIYEVAWLSARLGLAAGVRFP